MSNSAFLLFLVLVIATVTVIARWSGPNKALDLVEGSRLGATFFSVHPLSARFAYAAVRLKTGTCLRIPGHRIRQGKIPRCHGSGAWLRELQRV